MTTKEAVFYVLLAVVGLIVSALFAQWQRKQLTAIGEFLGGGSDSHSAWGSSLGVRATLLLEDRPRVKLLAQDRYWTQVSAELPAELPFAMELRRQGWEARRRIAKGKQVDVTVGDPAFDDAYVIDAEPVDVLRALLTPARRAALASYGDIELCTEPGPTPLLCLHVPKHLDDLRSARLALELVVDLATGVRDAYAQVKAAADRPAADAPSRQLEADRTAQ